MSPTYFATVSVALVLVLTPVAALAADLEPDAVQSSSQTPLIQWEYDQVHPRVAYSPESQVYLVVWEDHHWGFGLEEDIYGRLVARDGTPIGTAFSIGWEDTKHRSKPAVTHNPINNEFFVVYEYEYSDTDFDIYARRVTPGGSIIGAEIVIADSVQWESSPTVAHSTANNSYLIVFQARQSNDIVSPSDIVAQVHTNLGALVGGQRILAFSIYDESSPDVEYGPSSERFFVAYNYTTSASDRRIVAHLLYSDGSSDGSSLDVATGGANRDPRIAYNQVADQFLTVYDHTVPSGISIDGRIFRVQAREFEDTWTIKFGPDDDEFPVVAYSPASDLYLIPYEHEYSASDHDVICEWRHSDLLVHYEGQNVPVSTTGAHERHPDVASDGQFGGLVVWEDERDAVPNGSDIWARVMNVGVVSGFVYSGEPPDISTPIGGASVVLYGSGTVDVLGDVVDIVLSREDGPYQMAYLGNYDYYTIVETDLFDYQSIAARSPQGTVLDYNSIQFAAPLLEEIYAENNFWDISLVAVEHFEPIPGILSLSPPYPNPSDGEVTLHLRRGGAGAITLEVIDISGRVIRRLDVGEEPESVIRWDGRLDSGAIAPAGIYHMRARNAVTTVVKRVAIVR